MVTFTAVSALRVVVQSEERHARNELKRLSTATGIRRRGELATTYHWRQAKRHLRKAANARSAIALLGAV